MYSRGGDGPSVLEGVTEFFTRRISPGIDAERRAGLKYEGHFQVIQGQVLGNPMARQALLRRSFQGA